jgi:hypothetical protein
MSATYTVAPSVLALPVFAPFVLAGLDPASPFAAFVEKLAASLMVAWSTAGSAWSSETRRAS